MFIVVSLHSCGQGSTSQVVTHINSVPLDISHFADTKLREPISVVKCELSDGASTDCYRIVVGSEPHEHKMGPWCPRHIDDSKDEGGIWFEDDKDRNYCFSKQHYSFT